MKHRFITAYLFRVRPARCGLCGYTRFEGESGMRKLSRTQIRWITSSIRVAAPGRAAAARSACRRWAPPISSFSSPSGICSNSSPLISSPFESRRSRLESVNATCSCFCLNCNSRFTVKSDVWYGSWSGFGSSRGCCCSTTSLLPDYWNMFICTRTSAIRL